MKKFILSITAFFLFTGCILSASGQTAPTKVVVVNSDAFRSEKTGITKYVNAIKAYNAEVAPINQEIDNMSARFANLAKDIENLRSQAATGVRIDEAAAQAKVDEAERLQIDIKRKEEDAKVRFARRQPIVVGSVTRDIAKALNDFAKLKGYSVIFDLAKDQVGFLVAIGDAKVDVTAEFITYFNARP